MSQQKIAEFVAQSKEVITGLQKEAADKAAVIAAKDAELTKIAEAEKSAKAERTKLAADTANMLLQKQLIAAADLKKFAEGLAEPVAAHNMIRNLCTKLAEAQAPVRVGRASDKPQTKTAEEGKLNADAMFEQRLHEATGK